MRRASLYIALFLLAAALPAQKTLYVAAASSCTENCGDSWEKAYPDLQSALIEATLGGVAEIRVAQGTYTPHLTDRAVTFYIPDGIRLRGGYAGDPSQPDLRDVAQYVSILSGDLRGDDQPGFINYDDNSYHVITTKGVSSATQVDGFTIRGGYANDPNSLQGKDGAAWYNTQYLGVSSPTISNCTFKQNKAVNNGGAFYNGGLWGEVSPAFFNCTFTENEALTGGAVYNSANTNTASPSFTSCLFQKNQAVTLNGVSKATGAAVYHFAKSGKLGSETYTGYAGAAFANCIFADNLAANNAGAVYGLANGKGGLASVDITFTNATFYGNKALVGGAIYLNASDDGQALTTIINSIFWNNQAATDPVFHYSGTGGPEIAISYSIVDAVDCSRLIIDGEGSVTCSDMLFVPDSGVRIFVDAPGGNFHLADDSPAVNAGSNEAVSEMKDFEGDDRIQFQVVDMGADENSSVPGLEPIFFHDFDRARFVQLDMSTGNSGFNRSAAGVRNGYIPGHKQNQSPEIRHWKLFPNPAGNYLILRTTEGTEALIPYRITDARGRVVSQGEVSVTQGYARFDGLSDYCTPGIYILQLADQQVRWIKQ